MRLDSHQHFWKFNTTDYGWMKSDWPIRRDFLPHDLQPLLQQHAFDGVIAVQARQTLEESRWLLKLADENSIIKGVVGWVDLRSETVAEQLAELARQPNFVGVRHVVQDEPDERFLLRPEFVRGLKELQQFKLTYDLLLFPHQLPSAIDLAQKLSEQKFVLDHMGKPAIRDGTLDGWREDIRELAKSPNVFCKISGLVTEADWGNWKPADFKPYLDTVFEAFGEDRVIYGSDWPVCLLAGDYEAVFSLINNYAQQLSPCAHSQLFGDNTATFYGIKS
ncbi:MAG: amidohydrolase family protein [Verrucomicrobiota bacterium]